LYDNQEFRPTNKPDMIKPEEIERELVGTFTTQKDRIIILNSWKSDICKEQRERVYEKIEDAYWKCINNLNSTDLGTLEEMILTAPEPDGEFELKFCEECFQMTNHIGNICQKCKSK